jgi:hypothetical protein
VYVAISRLSAEESISRLISLSAEDNETAFPLYFPDPGVDHCEKIVTVERTTGSAGMRGGFGPEGCPK